MAVLFASTGNWMQMFAVDEGGEALLASLQLPQAVQYAAFDCRTNLLYVVCSDGGPGRQGSAHHLLALNVGKNSLGLAGDVIPLSSRPIHVAIDDRLNRLFVTYNRSPGLSVHPLGRNGEAGTATATGLSTQMHFPHQVFMPPFGQEAVVVCRGADRTTETPELPGALCRVDVDGRNIRECQLAAPGGGYGFGPRTAIYDHETSMVFLSLERQNQIAGITFGPEGFAPKLAFSLPSLGRPEAFKPQLAGALRMHPRLRILYQLNRTHSSMGGDVGNYNGEGENTVVAYRLGLDRAPPNIMQRVSSEGVHPRTLSLDDQGRLMAVANLRYQKINNNGIDLPARPGIGLFLVSDDGQLSFLRQLSLKAEQIPFWSSFASEILLAERRHAD